MRKNFSSQPIDHVDADHIGWARRVPGPQRFLDRHFNALTCRKRLTDNYLERVGILMKKHSNKWSARATVLAGTVAGAGSLLLSAAVPAWAVAGTITEYAIPTGASTPYNITPGPAADGALWFTEGSTTAGNKIGRITTAGVITNEFPLANGAGPDDIVAGPDGKMWFTESGNGHTGGTTIGRMETTGANYVEFPTKTRKDAGVRYIIPSPDGSQNLWFTEQLANKVAKITTTGTVTEYTLVVAGNTPQPNGIAAGPDGALWIAETGSNQIVRVDLTGTMTAHYSTGVQPFSVTKGSDNNIWYTTFGSNTVGRITVSTGAVTEWTIPTAGASPRRITAGPDGNLWFTEYSGNKIGRISTAGAFLNEFPVPTATSQPFGITSGPNNNLWFVENLGNKVGQITSA
jgi:streptogramin lyase